MVVLGRLEPRPNARLENLMGAINFSDSPVEQIFIVKPSSGKEIFVCFLFRFYEEGSEFIFSDSSGGGLQNLKHIVGKGE